MVVSLYIIVQCTVQCSYILVHSTGVDWTRATNSRAKQTNSNVLVILGHIILFNYYINLRLSYLLKRVRRGSDSSTAACCKAGPSSNLGSVWYPRGGPLYRAEAMRTSRGYSTSIIYKHYICLLDNCKNEYKKTVAACHQTHP
jgi:hypothetical protein